MITAKKYNDKIIVSGNTYYFKDIIKTIADCKWDATIKAWIVPRNSQALDTLQQLDAVMCEQLLQEVASFDNIVDGCPISPLPIKVQPYTHQVVGYNRAISLYDSRKGFALLADMGTGKTLTTIAIFGRLYLQGDIQKVLIVAPKSVLHVWQREIDRYADFDCNVRVGVPQDDFIDLGLSIIVCNYESVWRHQDTFDNYKFDFVVADESNKIKNISAKQSKAMHKLGKRSKYNIILSGTPIANSPLDIYSQYKFVDSTIFSESWGKFCDRYAKYEKLGYKKLVGYKDLSELLKRIHTVAYRVRLTSVVDMPPHTNVERIVELDSKTLAQYRDLHRGELRLLSHSISYDNVLVRLTKLAQFTSGFAKTEDGNTIEIHRAKLRELESLLDQLQHKKVVIFARFLYDIQLISELLVSKHINFVALHGDTKDRQQSIDRFQNDASVTVFVGQIATAGMGITLTASHTTIYYSLDFSYVNYEQSKSRIFRIGQSYPCTYIHLLIDKSIDKHVYKALQEKQDIARQIVDNGVQIVQSSVQDY